MYTANTMSSAIEAMGLSLPGSSTMAAEDDEKRECAAQSGRALANAIRKQIVPRQLLTRKAFENAFTVVMAAVGSVNYVLLLLAVTSTSADPPSSHVITS